MEESMTKKGLKVLTQSVNDVPLIIEMANQLKFEEILEKHLGTHGLQQGLNNGKLSVGWLAFIISQANHCKNMVREWSNGIVDVLQSCLKAPIREVEFSDDRLGNLLDRLSLDEAWEEIEKDLGQHIVQIYRVKRKTIRLDGTTTYGYHEVLENNLMQYGLSKDHRPDLPQVKLMTASLDPSLILAVDVREGQRNDDVLYLPLIKRIDKWINQDKLLYVGDSKMSSFAIRASIEVSGNYYLTPLALETASLRKYFQECVKKADQVNLVLIGNEIKGYEEIRDQELPEVAKWKERVLIIRSEKFFKSEEKKLEKKLESAQKKLRVLFNRRGCYQIKQENQMQEAIKSIVKSFGVEELLEVKYEVGKRISIKQIARLENKIKDKKKFLGWRIYLTNSPVKQLSLKKGILLYRSHWRVDQHFKILKKSGLGLSPLYVRTEKRIKGLVRLLSLAARLLGFMTYKIKTNLAKERKTVKGLWDDKKNKETAKPTALSILKSFSKANITLSKTIIDENEYWYLTPLKENLREVLIYLNISLSLYDIKYYQPLTKW
jgi:transposase